MADKIRVLLVEDDLDFVFLIKNMIEQDAALDYLTHADNKASGVALAGKLNPDIVLMDLNLSKSELDGIDAAREIRLTTDGRVILLTSFEQPEIIINASKKALASGYVFKSQCQTLTDTIRKTAASHTPEAQFIKELFLQDLSPAERQVLNMMLGEDTAIQSSAKTVANQKTSIFKKLGLKNTNELIHILKNW